MLTLRQIEVIRAIMVTGTVGGAARLLSGRPEDGIMQALQPVQAQPHPASLSPDEARR